MIVNIKLVIIKRIKSYAQRDQSKDEEMYQGSFVLSKNSHILFIYYLIIFWVSKLASDVLALFEKNLHLSSQLHFFSKAISFLLRTFES